MWQRDHEPLNGPVPPWWPPEYRSSPSVHQEEDGDRALDGGIGDEGAGDEGAGAGDGQPRSPVASDPRVSGAQHARRVRPEDTELVERTTEMLRALELVHDDATAAQHAVPAVWKQSTTNLPVTVVAGGSVEMARLRRGAPRRHRKNLLAGLVACVLCVCAIATLFYAVRPAGAMALGPSRLAATPHGGKDASNLGAWYSSSGAFSLGIGGGAGPGTNAPGSAGLPVKNPPKTSGASTNGVDVSAAPLLPWPPSSPWIAVPGHSAFAMQEPSNGFYYWAFGQCTWWAQYERQNENLEHMGNAQYWAGGAAGRGYTIRSAPKPNATVVFQPGVQGAGGAGHVAHVIAVYPGGWFLVSEMNFYWNGGGFARVDYRYAHSGWGVQFIY